MARNETNAIAVQSLAPSAEPGTRAPYHKPELDCLGSESTQFTSGAGSDGTPVSSVIS